MRRLFGLALVAGLVACVPTPDGGDPSTDSSPPEGDGALPDDMEVIDPDGAVDPDMAAVEGDMAVAADAGADPDGAVEADIGVDPDMAVESDAGPAVCADGETRERACGINGRGAQGELCVDDAWVDDGDCVDPDVCVDGAEEAVPCGPEDAGRATRICAEGQWAALGECVLPGECEDGAVDEVACGINGRGLAVRDCVAGMWGPPGPCDDPDVCVDGRSQDDACGLNGRGERTRDCIDGQWGAFGGCVDPDVCVDRAEQRDPCGINGRGAATRACVDGQWGAFGACDDPDECVDGTEESGPCGLDDIGLATRTCVDGRWSALGECVLPGECAPGDVDEVACGLNGRGAAARACVDGMWGPPGPCDDPDTCRDDRPLQAPCGLNGRGVIESRCVDGQVGPAGPCVDPDVCVDEAVEDDACGLNDRGGRSRSCVGGQWGAFGGCDDPDVCVDGAAQESACGLNDRGSRARTCAGGQWGAFGDCEDPDRCVDGAVEAEACGINGRGERTRTCRNGDFGQPTDCVDPDVCVDGTREERACGIRDDGIEQRLCADGQWDDWGPCAGACADACAGGDRRCGAGGVEICDDTDADPCLEWGPAEPCAADEACVDGACEPQGGPVVINEVFYDQAGADGTETFIELWGPAGQSVDGLALVAVNGNDGRDYVTMPLDGVIGADGYYLVTEPNAIAGLRAVADLIIDGADLQNGPDGLQLRRGAAVLDAVGYGDAGANFAGEGRFAPDPADGSAITRVEHVDTDDNAADFIEAPASPRGEPGDDPGCLDGAEETEACGDGGERVRICIDGAFGPWSPCDEPGGPVRIDDGGDFAGEPIPQGGSTDYRFDLDARARLLAFTWDGVGGCPGDTLLRLYTNDGGVLEQIAEDDDGGDGLCSRLDRALEPGPYVLRVEGFSRGAVPAYVLTVQFSCVEGDVVEEPCPGGTRSLVCTDGAFVPGLCGDAVCVDGDTEARACGQNGRGVQTRECVGGQWGDFGGCDDPDVCVDGTVDDALNCGQGRTQPAVCADGLWVARDVCVALQGDISAPGTYAQEAIPEGAADDFTFTLDEGALVRISSHDDGVDSFCPSDTFMTIYRVAADGTLFELDRDDDSGVGECARLELQLPAGEYIVRVNGAELVRVRAYALLVELEAGQPRVDDGGDFAGGPIAQNDEETFAFVLERPMIVEAFTSDGAGGCPGDTVMELHSGIRVDRIAFNDDDGGTLCSRIEEALEPGVYEIRVDGFQGNAVPAYVLTVNFRCPEGRVLAEPCADGIQTVLCVDGVYEPRGACGPVECADGDTEDAACGINGRGQWTRTCVGGRWAPFGPCADPDECEDGFVGDAPCGFNDRGIGPSRCVEGQLELTGACDDPDTCTDGAVLGSQLCSLDPDAGTCAGVHRPAPTCGIGGWAMTTTVCVDGQPAAQDCVDPIRCVPGTVQTVRCGRNGNAERSRTCSQYGEWSNFTFCDDPDVCDNPASRRVDCGPDDASDGWEECDDGQWQPTTNCRLLPPAEVFGYVEGSYEGYAILRVASTLNDELLQDAGLDRRVSGFIAGGERPYPDLEALAARPDVVAGTFDLLWAEAQARDWVPFCGDGAVMELEEQCDDGNNDDDDGCSAACELETECGNGVIDGVEQCDDGDVGAYDGCSPNCRLETHPTLRRGGGDGPGTPILPYLQAEYVEMFNPSVFNLDLRQTSRVRFDLGYRSPTSFWYGTDRCPGDYTATLQARIGNALYAGGGRCAQHGDGVYEFDEILPPGRWTMRFEEEDGFRVVSMLSGRIDPVDPDGPVCGDGVREGDEQCDDGNTVDNDGCSPGCLIYTELEEINDNFDRDLWREFPFAGALLRGRGFLNENQAGFSDEDHFVFDSNGGRTVIQLSDADGNGCDVDAGIALWRGVLDRFNGGTLLASSVEGGIDFCPRIETQLPAGTYSAVVQIAPPGRGGSYRLEIRTTPLSWDDGVPEACQAWCLGISDCQPRSNVQLDQCTRRCTDGTLEPEDMLRVRDAEQCLVDGLGAEDQCAALRACVADAEPVVDCAGLCAEMSACGMDAADCQAACDAEIFACADPARRLGGGCAEVTACFGAPVENTDCATYCDARILCDETVDRFACEQACIAGPGSAARGSCAARTSCAGIERCIDLDPAVPAACVEACADVEGCGLFEDTAACEAYCAGQANLVGAGYGDTLTACIADVAACGYAQIHCFAPPVCEGESADIEVIDLEAGTIDVDLSVTAAGVEDDMRPFCALRGSIENFTAVRLAFPAEVSVRNRANLPAAFFIVDACEPLLDPRCGYDGDDVVTRVLGPGTYYLGAEQDFQSDRLFVDFEVTVRPLDAVD